MPSTKIEIENVNVPGPTHRVDAGKYPATKEALDLGDFISTLSWP